MPSQHGHLLPRAAHLPSFRCNKSRVPRRVVMMGLTGRVRSRSSIADRSRERERDGERDGGRTRPMGLALQGWLEDWLEVPVKAPGTW